MTAQFLSIIMTQLIALRCFFHFCYLLLFIYFGHLHYDCNCDFETFASFPEGRVVKAFWPQFRHVVSYVI